MNICIFMCNVPWTIIGILCAFLSIPQKISFLKDSQTIIVHVKSFWWYAWLPTKTGVRAMAIGQTILLGENILKNDLEHELVHVRQAMREPFIYPFLYMFENFKKGYKNNKYETEAYETTESVFVNKE